jgi:gamma-glutamylcyclotransferase (GGCT)/AIG2-like uncharacterized protein YtfP
MPNQRVFVYGTLLFPAVLRAVTGAEFPRRAARLEGFARYGLRGEVVPALVADPSASTEGALLEAVGQAALDALDRFEGALYQRRGVVVTVASRPLGAQTYALALAQRARLTREPWDPARFAAQDLAAFLARYR